MKKPIIEDVESAVAYIKTVLEEWDAWKTHHISLVEALEILLKSYESKSKSLLFKCEYIDEMKKYIADLHRKIEYFYDKEIECND